MTEEALKDLLYRLADDQLILGHRNSEWTGLGPILEEDIAFSSMAQDKIGHSLLFYQLLEELGEGTPDQIAFLREAENFKNCQMTELPNGDYAFSLMRHFLFDIAETHRMNLLTDCSIEEISIRAKKIKGELIYHSLHGKSWISKLGNGTEESIAKMQSALDALIPYALGMFEVTQFENQIIEGGVFPGEKKLQSLWWESITEIIHKTSLKLRHLEDYIPLYGGRRGEHTQHLKDLIGEMSEVIRIDPNAEW